MSKSWKEVEMNQRPPVLYASRVSVQAAPTEVVLRFLHIAGVQKARNHDESDTYEITNVADVALSPSVAKRLIVDLQTIIESHEDRLGRIAAEDDLLKLWKQGQTQ